MDEYSDLRNFPEVRVMEANTRQVLDELVRTLDLERRQRGREEEERPLDDDRWRRRYERNLRRLAEAGIKTRDKNNEDGFDHYREQRKEWEDKLQRLSNYLGYDWDEVTGDTDPEYAADEKKEESLGTPSGEAGANSERRARGGRR
jgi:hypothetical protein